MALLFTVIARGNTILAKYASCAGNFSEVVEQVLARISPENGRLTYSHGSYLFHYITENRVTYLCITDDDYERSKAFSFLAEIRRRFVTMYSDRAQTALPYAMNSEFSKVLAGQMRYYSSEASDGDTIRRVENEVDELKGIMVKNIDSIASRGERLELLVDKTNELSENSVTFKKTSRTLARSMWWKNTKLTVLLVLVIIVREHLYMCHHCT
ncbi:hypothetical protein NP493_133g02049 [Ridgeia piscesae]|uniref:Vesicle-associated membrane protein 7 n=1 Tax=Ridgeia piscesae TaxID=27915 RepID=A0AAD9P5F1_RIDPI|nr:hypothetical protein NP493_133g02049 [Ridgeia piscesae]